MKIKHLLLTLALFIGIATVSFSSDTLKTISYNNLPQGAKDVINKIQNGSSDWPFVKKDGSRFGNREKRLPVNNNALYKEYTVCTAKMNSYLKKGKRPNRGARRIIYDVKNKIFYFTKDHYKNFSRVVFKNEKH